MEDVYNELIKNISQSEVLLNEPMKNHTTFRIGGLADIFIKVKSVEDLKTILKIAKNKNIAITIIGNGSNILVKDNGIRGIVIKLEMEKMSVKGTEIEANAGVALAKVCKRAQKEGLTGLEFAYGIPGTVGGAVFMNAGAYGKEMKDVVKKTTYIDKDLSIKTISNEEQEFSYRKSIFAKKDVIILSTVLSLQQGNKDVIEMAMEQNIKARREKQPLDYPNAGSTFKRGNNFITAKVIDEAGLKGYHIGDAMVSTKHSGFVINTGNATAKDVLELVDYIKKVVKEKFNYDIELEIKVLGEVKN